MGCSTSAVSGEDKRALKHVDDDDKESTCSRENKSNQEATQTRLSSEASLLASSDDQTSLFEGSLIAELDPSEITVHENFFNSKYDSFNFATITTQFDQ